MFSGKTEELIRRLFRAKQSGRVVCVFKPKIDVRYSTEEIVSHSGLRIDAYVTDTLVLPAGADPDVVGIDEAQFFGAALIPFVEDCLQKGVRVIASGLDLTFKGEPFHPMPHLLALADDVVKLHAVCARCLKDASRTYRLADHSATVLVGGAESYEPRCLACFPKEGYAEPSS